MRELEKLKIKDVGHLCKHLGTTPEELEKLCSKITNYYRETELVIKGKRRPIAEPVGRLRNLLDRLQDLLQRIENFDNVQGGRKGRSTISNARSHLRKPIVINLDIEDFFPSIGHRRVYDVFRRLQECSPDVSRYLTRLTTFKGSLPQGSPTSTILASIVTKSLAARLRKASQVYRVNFTQYVDDITISGGYHALDLISKVKQVITQEGFAVNFQKTKIMIGADEKVVTGIRVNSFIDIPSLKRDEVREQIMRIIERRRQGLKISEKELISLEGKISHVSWLNKGTGKHLHRLLHKGLRGTNA